MPSDVPELPQDPREREILLRALRRYSDDCEPPELTPDCPYSEKAGPGLRGCGNEDPAAGRHRTSERARSSN